MALPITALFAGLLALWILVLTMMVVSFRRGEQVSLGYGGSSDGLRLIRGHGNATETIPIFLILLALAEGLGWPPAILYGIGGAFTLGRVLHGIHFMKKRTGLILRMAGMLLSLLATFSLALGLIGTVVSKGLV